jgi:hypothetical protein
MFFLSTIPSLIGVSVFLSFLSFFQIIFLPRFFLSLSSILPVYSYSLFPFLSLFSIITFSSEAISVIYYACYYKELWLLDPANEVVTKPQNLRNYYPTDAAHIQQDLRLQFYPLCDVEYQS